MLGIMCLFQDAASVGLAAAMTAAVTFGLTLFACFTKIDFTGAGAYLVAALWALIICGVIGAVFGGSYGIPWSQNLYAGLGCILFSLFIVYDTQLIVGGKHKKYQFSLDDYVFAALNIYLDIINLFIYILQILNSRD
jgi:FtsH-binding integral membrane protein